MILISRSDRERLDNVGLLKYKKIGPNPQDPNFVVINKEHMSRNKRYYVVETPEIMAFLQKYDNLNLQKIKQNQLDGLLEKKMVSVDQIQHPGEYKPNAIVFVSDEGIIRIKKIARSRIELGYWKTRAKSV